MAKHVTVDINVLSKDESYTKCFICFENNDMPSGKKEKSIYIYIKTIASQISRCPIIVIYTL